MTPSVAKPPGGLYLSLSDTARLTLKEVAVEMVQRVLVVGGLERRG